MAEIKFAMWNCSGLLSGNSASEKVGFLQVCPSFDVLALIETHHQKLQDVQALLHIFSTSYTIFHTEATNDDPYAGIVLLVSNRLTTRDSSVLLTGRILNLKVSNGKEEFNLSALYGYTGTRATPEGLGRIIDLLSTSHSPSDRNIIMGDFNFVDNELDRTNKNISGMNNRDAPLARKWTDFVNAIDLSDPFRFLNPRKRMFSYVHTQHGAKSRIDRVYMNEEDCPSTFYYKHTMSKWPHRVVTFSVKEKTEHGPGFWKMNASVLNDRAYSLMVEATIEDIKGLNIEDPIERWLIFIETIRLETQVYCSRKRHHERRVKKQCELGIELLEQNSRLHDDVNLQIEYEYLRNKLNDWTRKQIDGHQIRMKTQPKFESCEPNIDFYANLEKKTSKKRVITHLIDRDGVLKTKKQDVLGIATNFYTNLFSSKHSDERVAFDLLGNVDKHLSREHKVSMDRHITKEELRLVVRKLKRNKSPGPDGILAEFYQQFWHLIEDFYFDFITEVENKSFPPEKNSSITSLIYKNKGDIGLLEYYRPIALMNVDVKILTKLLSMRLVTVLPTIIHKSQAAVYGRTIDSNIHMVRDIIDMVNKDDDEAALLFIDQEKAFDRVNHAFLYKVLRKFGVGDWFIHWVELIYSNASTRININGFFTGKIPLRCGVRQGCPLSALLYVMVIEILALQLRANSNIVGFTLGGERIVSVHYADDTVIKITQNRCFKEVYKELQRYEQATGAKVNYEKTQGLWLGRWKFRKDDPFAEFYDDPAIKIKWTSDNVKHLGIYVGNKDPVGQTFNEIIPKVMKRLNFWKPLKLPVLAKSRVIEIFHASKLFYAASFYSIPSDMEKVVMDAFVNYINFPRKKMVMSRMEMEKLRDFGGAKLINIKLKAATPKIHWLMKLLSDEDLEVHRLLFEKLVGSQTWPLTAADALFAETSYIKRCRIDNSFYSEALIGISKLELYKHYSDIRMEHFAFNPIFVTSTGDDMHDKTLTPFRGNRILANLRTYGDLLDATNTLTNQLLAAVRRKIDSIEHIRDNVESHLIVGMSDRKEYEFNAVSQKLIYSELIFQQSYDHHSSAKWVEELNEPVDWDKIWTTLHNQFYTEVTKSTIWEQIHLNFYTTYNFNSWFKELNPCPLCRKIPDDVFHIILDCQFTKVAWRRARRSLMQIIPIPPTRYEMAFGLCARNKQDEYPIALRNWITFSLRHLITLEERKMYKINTESDVVVKPSMEKFFAKFNFFSSSELKLKKLLYDFQGLPDKFEKIVTAGGAIADVIEGDYVWNDIM